MRRELWIGLVLVVLTAAVYWPVRQFQFTCFDDNEYVTENYHVRGGLTTGGVTWAFTSFHSSNWHPLTWLSHMLDCQLFGLNPGGHHLMNVGLHAVNSLLLFALLVSLTGAACRSALVAGLFAWHPMHVESVAWVAERKDVLSTCLGLLSLLAYVRAKRHRPVAEADNFRRGRAVLFGLSLLLFGAALMAKPMMVTLPFVMLLLDFWPLERTVDWGRESPASLGSHWGRLVAEKAPFFALSAASCVLTFMAQQRGGAVVTLGAVPMATRLANVPVSYVRYLGKMFWPSDLCAYYPAYELLPKQTIFWAALLMLTVTISVCCLARTLPYLAMGWFWFLGTLIPVIGLVQVGAQALADRYSYLPYAGVFIALVWGASDLTRSWRGVLFWLPKAAAGAMLAGCLWLTHLQLPCWHDTITLFDRAVAVTSRNQLALTNLGAAMLREGRLEEGVARLREALALQPDAARTRASLMSGLESQGKISEAIDGYHQVLRQAPDMPEALNNLSLILATDWQATNRNGVESLKLALHACELTAYSRPPFLSTLAAAYAETAQFSEAISTATRAIADAVSAGDSNFAQSETLRRELYLKHQPFHNLARPANEECQIALKLSNEGKTREAIGHYRKALGWNPDNLDAMNNLALILATDSAATNRNGAEAVSLAEKVCELTRFKTPAYVGTLAEAYAEAGRFDLAIATGNQAAQIFDQAGNQPLANLSRELVELFRSRRAYHDGM